MHLVLFSITFLFSLLLYFLLFLSHVPFFSNFLPSFLLFFKILSFSSLQPISLSSVLFLLIFLSFFIFALPLLFSYYFHVYFSVNYFSPSSFIVFFSFSFFLVISFSLLRFENRHPIFSYSISSNIRCVAEPIIL